MGCQGLSNILCQEHVGHDELLQLWPRMQQVRCQDTRQPAAVEVLLCWDATAAIGCQLPVNPLQFAACCQALCCWLKLPCCCVCAGQSQADQLGAGTSRTLRTRQGTMGLENEKGTG